MITRDSIIVFREITEDTVLAVCNLSVTEDQRNYVANNAKSIAQAHFSKHAWFRAIYADDTPVGFIMLEDQPEKPEYFLWRFMIDQRYQGLGFGEQAIKLIIEHVKTRPNATEMLTSTEPGPNTPRPFYERMGFEATGEIIDGETMLRYVF